jgi:hypothetical protein
MNLKALCLRVSCEGQLDSLSSSRVLRATKIVRAIEALALLLVFMTFATTPGSATTYPVTDSFSGSGTLSSNWTNSTAAGGVALAQSGGTVGLSVSGQHGLALYTGTTFANDQYAQTTFVNHSSAGGATGVCVRMNAAGNGVCYMADYGLIYAMVDGAASYNIATGCPIPSSGDTIRLTAIGVTYTCKDVTTVPPWRPALFVPVKAAAG